MNIYSSVSDKMGNCLCYWIESKFTFVIAEIVTTKYRV